MDATGPETPATLPEVFPAAICPAPIDNIPGIFPAEPDAPAEAAAAPEGSNAGAAPGCEVEGESAWEFVGELGWGLV